MPFVDWVNKNQAKEVTRSVPIHLLKQEAIYGGKEDLSPENLLIQGDNLLALKALIPVYAGRVKCIFIDPPYNTQSAFEHYDDKLEHSQWLSTMYPRLVLLRELLAEHGSIWVSIDDNEAHYLKVLMDEVFGRMNFIVDIAWKRRDGAPNDRKIGSTYDHVLVFSRARKGAAKRTHAEESFNFMQRTEKANAEYRLYEEPFGFDERGPFRKVDSTGNAKGGRYVESLFYPVVNPFTGEAVYPRKGRCWVYKQDDMKKMIADRRFFWGKDGKAGTPMRKLFRSEAKQGMTAPTIWDDVGLNQHAARELELLFGEKASFETPKPEGLIKRILEIATNSGDLVLDSFLGSGTTAAVAHKMGRRYIGIEMGEHARTHCIPRLQKVIDGEQGGISEAVGWQGGGGFRFCTLGQAAYDADGRINPEVRFGTLAAFVWHYETATPRTASGSSLASIRRGTSTRAATTSRSTSTRSFMTCERRPQQASLRRSSCALRRWTCIPRFKHWVRNIERQEKFSFWLPTSTDYFYPDFVAELTDGRLLVVEYKGEPYKSNDDSREKKQVGRQWEKSSGNRCLFLFAVAKDEDGRSVRTQIADKIGEPARK